MFVSGDQENDINQFGHSWARFPNDCQPCPDCSVVDECDEADPHVASMADNYCSVISAIEGLFLPVPSVP